MTDDETPKNPPEGPAARALAEAAERRKLQAEREVELAKIRELDGRKGPDPVRYGDWEAKGLASDF
ncbi:DUF1674 domain-containing protein [Chenggangzhangella methanolivorans]|uniref:DUF1674 domain-containing protein n=1 Tax=Chenggangzhangella methanolivorans TaxID=1437009 RepID=A0A9E6UNC3_9HYPH|nr:DUF1674 domain-containing protein [Chenggangzhangella methanolivorans]QZN98354.1 DUF1674 domain-containing protein [Chenggangzhangella methanolivorans]